MITFEVRACGHNPRVIEIPGDINLSLMEALKASEYPIAATCGGIALCATCCVEVVEGHEQLEEPAPAELDMLDTLPAITSASRLACQIKVDKNLQGVVLELKSFQS